MVIISSKKHNLNIFCLNFFAYIKETRVYINYTKKNEKLIFPYLKPLLLFKEIKSLYNYFIYLFYPYPI